MHFQKLLLIGVLLFSCGAVVGCGEGRRSADDITRRANGNNMQRLMNLYTRHQLTNSGEGPADETQFKEFIRNLGESSLTKVGIDVNAIDDVFVSEDDSQPFEIRYKVYGGSRGSNQAIVFQRTAVEGKRKIGFTSRKIIEADDQEYEDLLAGKAVEGANEATTNPNRRR